MIANPTTLHQNFFAAGTKIPSSLTRAMMSMIPKQQASVLMPGMQATAKATIASIPSSSVLTTSIASTTILAVRGGALAEAAFDLNRARIHLEGLLSAYGLIAVLLMNSIMKLYTTIIKTIKIEAVEIEGQGPPHTSKTNRKIENAARVSFVVLSTLGILSGITTSIIFSFLGLYSKTHSSLKHKVFTSLGSRP
jgi:hypothetical protein